MREALLEGRRYRICFEGESASNLYTYTVDHYFDKTRKSCWWYGSLKVIDEETGSQYVATFRSPSYRSYPSAKWPEEIDTLEKAVFLVEKDVGRLWGESDVFDRSKIVDQARAIDLLAEKIIAKIQDSETTTIPAIQIPLLKLSELQERGIAPLRDGQLVMDMTKM